ncbi:MAG TPA: hypothetical protein VGL11_08535 [Candidatus Binatia bacterium]
MQNFLVGSLLAALILAMPLAAHPAAPAEVTTVGAGSDSCRQWTEARNDPGTHYQYRQWIFGFVSGYNSHDPSNQIVPPDSSAVIEWIDNFCKANPQRALYFAAASLAKKMAKSAQPPKPAAKKP